MKFKCALSDSQIKKLYAHVYGNMSKTADAKQAFDPKTYMQDLFEKIKNSSDEDTAAKFIQQVPRLMMVAAVKPKTLTLRIDTNPIRDRIIEFNDPESGIENTIKYFKKEVNPDLERSIIESKQNDAFEVKEKDPEQQITTNPARLKPYSVYTATFQEFYALNPNLKDATTQEQADDSKRRIYKTLEKIKNGIDIDNTILDDVVYQGQTLKLKAVRVNQLDQRYIDNYTKDLIVRSISIQNQGTQEEDVTPVQNMLALVITDENGKELYFNDEGDIVSKAEGKLVYQFLRDVRLKNKRYTVTDIYGKEAQILSPKAIARVEGITEEEADRMQQEEFKEVYDFKTRILKTGSEKLDFVSVSPGVDVTIFNNKLSFNRLKGLSVGTRDVFTSIRVADEFSDYDSGTAVITIKGQDFNIDRPAITNELSQKIAAVLTDRNLTPTEKNDYVSQFLSNNLSESVRRHRMIYDPKNKVFGFSFNRFTLNERNKNKVSDEVTFDLRERAISYPPKSFGFYEYSAPQYCKIEDRNAWAMANPSLDFSFIIGFTKNNSSSPNFIKQALFLIPNWVADIPNPGYCCNPNSNCCLNSSASSCVISVFGHGVLRYSLNSLVSNPFPFFSITNFIFLFLIRIL